MHHFVGRETPTGEVCIYVGKPKKDRGWIGDQKHLTRLYLVTMGFRRQDGTTYSERYVQPITDSFETGGVKP